ncbi:MAG: hypothetical protein Tsb0034_10370 [Ekhidna sp.]
MLREAVESLIMMDVPTDFEMIFIVCDNGTTFDAYEIIGDLLRKIPFDSFLIKEENQGIAFMRNRILEEALTKGADYLAFFDDDEKVDKSWIIELTNAMLKYSANVIQGEVLQNFPEGVDTEILRRYYPGSFSEQTGKELNDAYTNNVIFDLSMIKSYNLRFSNRFNITGGSDSYFFRKLKSYGAKIVFCKEAIVTETIPKSKASIDWILSRYYRNGYTKHLMDVADYGKYKAFWVSFKYVFKSVKSCLSLLFSKSKVDDWKMKKLNRCLRAKGMLHAMFGLPFKEYELIHGK